VVVNADANVVPDAANANTEAAISAADDVGDAEGAAIRSMTSFKIVSW
jgi:hypothetical protein